MRKKIFVIALCVVTILAFSANSVSAANIGDSAQRRSLEDIENEKIFLQTASAKANNAQIMQGNTLNESDCLAIYNGLGSGGYAAVNIANTGWIRASNGTSSLLTQRTTANDYLWGSRYTFSYYSGHGGKDTGYPVLNKNTGNSSTQSGTFTTFNAASTLGVSGSNWSSSTVLNGYYSRVQVLAACHLLDSTIMKYYGRVMKTSGMRAVAGYHVSAPTHQTDRNIATAFLTYAAAGESVWSAWKQSNNNNGNQGWAVLLYRDGNNMYFRIPGFPGNTYSNPSSSAGIFRYASHLQNTTIYQSVSLNAPSISPYVQLSVAAPKVEAVNDINDLPLYVYVAENETVNSAFDKQANKTRETIDTDYEVAMNKAITDKVALNLLASAENANIMFAATPEIRTEFDPESGAIKGTDVTVSWDQRYYNTYKGIRVNNAYLYYNIDTEGIVATLNNWKDVFPALIGNTAAYITEKEARDNATKAGYNVEDATMTLVYEPTEKEGINKLCYEFDSRDGRVRVDVETGEMFNMR